MYVTTLELPPKQNRDEFGRKADNQPDLDLEERHMTSSLGPLNSDSFINGRFKQIGGLYIVVIISGSSLIRFRELSRHSVALFGPPFLSNTWYHCRCTNNLVGGFFFSRQSMCEPGNAWFSISIQILNALFTYMAIQSMPWWCTQFLHVTGWSCPYRRNDVGFDLFGMQSREIWYHIPEARRIGVCVCLM
jgi:hypothetical protein